MIKENVILFVFTSFFISVSSVSSLFLNRNRPVIESRIRKDYIMYTNVLQDLYLRCLTTTSKDESNQFVLRISTTSRCQVSLILCTDVEKDNVELFKRRQRIERLSTRISRSKFRVLRRQNYLRRGTDLTGYQ